MSDQPTPPGGPGAGLLDWNEAWQAARARTGRRRGRESWDKRAPSFARSVAQGPRIWLLGGEDDFAELVAHRAA